MENASKALIMAASVLLGVMIISIGVVLFRTFSDFSADSAQKMADKQISEWNNTYLKYYGNISYRENEDDENSDIKDGPIRVTAHDIVSVVNNAIENNIYYFGNNTNDWPSKSDENYYYVEVKIHGTAVEKEWCKDETEKTKFLSENSLIPIVIDGQTTYEPKYYMCKIQPSISSVTKRVYSISFEDYKI